ncbi:MAG TPA: alpha/beta family hydrolase [Anaerolineae bacterium]|nr:alpha/beta family hydrolase [Anaerolineae bacterium]
MEKLSAEGAGGAEVTMQVNSITLAGILAVPKEAQGIVLFAHGGGSGRHSPRNQLVASLLQQGGLATLLIDLLTLQEEAVDLRTREHRFNIPLLADRLVGTTDWLLDREDAAALRVGYFGSSTGAAAALIAAAERPQAASAVVSRGGRVDLAADALARVRAPTLLIVGGNDHTVINLNRQAMGLLKAPTELEIIPGAGHLFEEPGALEKVAHLARDWFQRHLTSPLTD